MQFFIGSVDFIKTSEYYILHVFCRYYIFHKCYFAVSDFKYEKFYNLKISVKG